MPKDEDITLDDMAVGADGFLKRIPEEIRSTFTDQQIAAINQVFRPAKHSVDIRVSVPLPWGRRYFVLLSGNERRSQSHRHINYEWHLSLSLHKCHPDVYRGHARIMARPYYCGPSEALEVGRYCKR